MRLIPSNSIKGSISEAEILLRERGILASDASSYANIPRYSTAAKSIKKGVWVHLNHQYNDAIKVLNDPDHVVATALSHEQMKEIEKEAKQALLNASTAFFSEFAAIVLGLSLAVIIIYGVYSA